MMRKQCPNTDMNTVPTDYASKEFTMLRFRNIRALSTDVTIITSGGCGGELLSIRNIIVNLLHGKCSVNKISIRIMIDCFTVCRRLATVEVTVVPHGR